MAIAYALAALSAASMAGAVVLLQRRLALAGVLAADATVATTRSPMQRLLPGWAIGRGKAFAAWAGWDIRDRAVADVIGGGVVVSLLALLILGPLGLILPICAIPVVRFVGGRRRSRRRAEVASEVPHLLDVLAACSTAGLSVPGALGHASQLAHGVLGVELRAAVRDAELGKRWDVALSEAAQRVEAPDLQRAISVLRRAERLGVPLAETLVPLAADARATHFARAMDRARKAPVKMLFPLVFLVLPAFLLLTVVPVMVSTFGSI